MMPFAEQFLQNKQDNQWFVRFFAAENDLAGQQVKQNHFTWFANQGLEVTQVRTQEYDLPQTNFYHVNFVSDSDVRLKAYSDLFEDSQGVSLQPAVYQLYEWSYAAWCESGLQAAWCARMPNNT